MNIFDLGIPDDFLDMYPSEEGLGNPRTTPGDLWNPNIPIDPMSDVYSTPPVTNEIPRPSPYGAMGDVSGFANFGMQAPQLQNMPFSPMVSSPLQAAPQAPPAPGLPAMGSLPMVDASVSASIPSLRRDDLNTIFSPQKRRVEVPKSKLTAYLGSLGVSNG